MRNIVADMTSVITFYRALVLEMKDKGYDVNEVLNRIHIEKPVKDEVEYLNILLEED